MSYPDWSCARTSQAGLIVAGLLPVVVFFHLPRHVVVGFVEKLDQAVYLVAGFLTESPYRSEHFLAGNGPLDVQRNRWTPLAIL
jgi:hypothetical protein